MFSAGVTNSEVLLRDESGLRAETLVTEPALPVRERRFYRLNIDFAP